jgi:putative transposase
MKDNKKTSRECISEKDLTKIDVILHIFNNHAEVIRLLVNEYLSAGTDELTGKKSSRNTCHEYGRYGYNPSSIRFGNERIKIDVPRVQHLAEGTIENVPCFQNIKYIQSPKEDVIIKMMAGVSTRNYESVTSQFMDSFGLSKSNISRAFVEQSYAALEAFENRKLEDTYVAVYVDGKYMSGSQFLIAVGVNTQGEKKILGFRESTGENSESIAELYRDILNRGFKFQIGFLLVVDGAKGWQKAAYEVFGNSVVIQRCWIHKLRNVMGHLGEKESPNWETRLKDAYNNFEYEDAKNGLKLIAQELESINLSASKSLLEGLEEILTLHRLRISKQLRISFYSTNPIESINADLERRLKRMKNQKDSRTKHRWVAVSLLEQEKKLGKVKTHTKINQLIEAIQNYVVNLNPNYRHN